MCEKSKARNLIESTEPISYNVFIIVMNVFIIELFFFMKMFLSVTIKSLVGY
jgi:hypothetical protein